MKIATIGFLAPKIHVTIAGKRCQLICNACPL
jgi:hypothetical protein